MKDRNGSEIRIGIAKIEINVSSNADPNRVAALVMDSMSPPLRYASGEEPMVGDVVGWATEHQAGFWGQGVVEKIESGHCYSRKVSGYHPGHLGDWSPSSLRLVSRGGGTQADVDAAALCRPEPREEVPDVPEGKDVSPTAAQLEEIFRAKVVPLPRGTWAWGGYRDGWFAVLQRGGDVRVLAVSLYALRRKGELLEPSLAPRRREAQAFMAVCIDKAKTFWEAPKR